MAGLPRRRRQLVWRVARLDVAGRTGHRSVHYVVGRVRRPGAGRKPATANQSGLLDALRELVSSAIRGDPEAALLWVSKSQRHIAEALGETRI